MHAQAHTHVCTHTPSIRGHQSLYFCTLSWSYLAPYADRHTYGHIDISEHLSGLSLYSLAQEQNKKHFIYETFIYAEDRKPRLHKETETVPPSPSLDTFLPLCESHAAVSLLQIGRVRPRYTFLCSRPICKAVVF